MCFMAAFTASMAAAETPRAVSGLGFVEPAGGIIRLSGPVSSGAASVAELKVKEGDDISKGQVLALLDNHASFKAAMEKSLTDVDIKKASLARVIAGASASEIDTQKAAISQIEVELNLAKTECVRQLKLIKRKVASKAASERQCAQRDILLQRLKEAQFKLVTLSTIRKEDIALREAELKNAFAAVDLAKAELETTLVRSPINGKVLVVHTQSGERITDNGILEIGRTDQMWVSAEIYETDISRVSKGQAVIIESDGFTGRLNGTIERVGQVVGQNKIVEAKPRARFDARVVEVKIAVDVADSAQVAQLTNLQVTVIIQPHDHSKPIALDHGRRELNPVNSPPPVQQHARQQVAQSEEFAMRGLDNTPPSTALMCQQPYDNVLLNRALTWLKSFAYDVEIKVREAMSGPDRLQQGDYNSIGERAASINACR